MHIDRIRSLGCWQNEPAIRPLPGGITNTNYRVADGTSEFVARVCEDRRFLGICRENERLCQQAAFQAGVAPEVVHFEDGILASRFVASRTLAGEDLHAPGMLSDVAATLRKLHGARGRLAGEMLFFCPFQTVRTYCATARRLAAELPPDIGQMLDDAQTLSQRMSPYQPTLCHNDLLPANILDDGRRLWLVDWEYAGIGNPLFDLASVSANGSLTEELENHLLAEYAGGAAPQMAAELRILKTVSLLREALWAVIQTVKSELDFDFRKYARDNFQAYQRARNEFAM